MSLRSYREGAEVLEKGLSPFSRAVLGFFSGLFGFAMLAIAPESSSPVGVYLFALFCLAIAGMCLFPRRVRRALGVFIAITILAIGVCYLVYSLLYDRSTLDGAAMFLVAFGFPAFLWLTKGKLTSAQAKRESRP